MNWRQATADGGSTAQDALGRGVHDRRDHGHETAGIEVFGDGPFADVRHADTCKRSFAHERGSVEGTAREKTGATGWTGRFRRRCPEGLRNSPRPVRGRRRIRDARGSHSPLRAERQTDRPTRHQAGRVQGSGREDLRGLRTHVPVHRGALAADGQPRTSSRISPGAMSVETPSFVHAEFVNPAPHAPHFARSPTLTARRASPRETARDEEPWRLSLRAPPGRHRRSDCDR